jgi:ketosteroid isomerase-like protein
MSTATIYLPEENLIRVSAEDEVKQIEYEWGEAFERRDMATLDRLMADEYILTDPLGNVRSKAESLAALKTNEIHFESTKSDNVKVVINGDTAVVTGRSTFKGRYKGWPMGGRYQYTDVLAGCELAYHGAGNGRVAAQSRALRLQLADIKSLFVSFVLLRGTLLLTADRSDR